MTRAKLVNLTASVLLEHDKKLLLVKEGEGSAIGKWNTPSGHIEHEEDIHDAAMREGKEESGYDIVLTDLLRIYHVWNKDGSIQVNYSFLARPVSLKQHELAPDVIEARWYSRQEIERILNTKDLRSMTTRARLRDWLLGPHRPTRDHLVATIRG